MAEIQVKSGKPNLKIYNNRAKEDDEHEVPVPVEEVPIKEEVLIEEGVPIEEVAIKEEVLINEEVPIEEVQIEEVQIEVEVPIKKEVSIEEVPIKEEVIIEPMEEEVPINEEVAIEEEVPIEEEAQIEEEVWEVERSASESDAESDSDSEDQLDHADDETIYDIDLDPLPNNKFVSGVEAYDMIKRHGHVFNECPIGPKSNVWFLVDNKENVERMSEKLKCIFYDDCGEWEPAKSNTHQCYYLLTDNFKVIFKKGEEYCTKVRRNKETIYVPLKPQPKVKNIVLMIRYGSVLRNDPTFRKHVTFFTSEADPELGEVALYEYMGSNNGNMVSLKKKPKRMAVVKEELEIKRRKKQYSENKMTLTHENKLESPIGNLPHGAFTTGFQAYDIVKRHHEVFEECPPGDKSNKWILVDNRDNIRRVEQNLKRSFYDDCGSWDSKTSRVHHRFYLINENFKIVFKNQDIYYVKKQIKGKRMLNVPLNPQPKPTNVVEMYRYEINLVSDPNFKKRVTYFIKPDDPGISEVALYEYMGTYKGTPSKVRTNPKILDKIRNQIRDKLPCAIYNEICLEDPSIKSSKQIRNLKYRLTHSKTKKEEEKKKGRKLMGKKTASEKKVFHIV